MSAHKCRLIKPPSLFIDHVMLNFDKHTPTPATQGSLEVPVGAALEVGETYRVELPDGRAGQIRVTSFNDISTKGEFEVVGSLE